MSVTGKAHLIRSVTSREGGSKLPHSMECAGLPAPSSDSTLVKSRPSKIEEAYLSPIPQHPEATGGILTQWSGPPYEARRTRPTISSRVTV